MRGSEGKSRTIKEFSFLRKELNMINNSAFKSYGSTIETSMIENSNQEGFKNQQQRTKSMETNRAMQINKHFTRTNQGDDYGGNAQFFKERMKGKIRINRTDITSINQDESTDANAVYFTSQIEKKPKGFVDFDLQISRPDICGANAHDQRFEPFDIFPKNSSNTKTVPTVTFVNYLPRSDKIYNAKMSEPLFDREKHLNLYKPGPKGILQFGKMLSKKELDLGNNRQGRRINLLLNQKEEYKSDTSQLYGVKGPHLDKQQPRTNDRTEDLPLYMQNINGRIGMNNQLGRSLYDNHYREANLREPTTTFCLKKDFRVDNKNKKRNANFLTDGPKKRSLTFNQLLAKYGYIEDESMTKKERKREWHIKKVKEQDSDSSDDF